MTADLPKRPFLERPGPWGTSVGLLILMGFFFVLPSGFRGGRLALKNKENNVKDWLPSDFPETAELDWFAKHFAGESFVLATWPGCNVGDQRLRLLEQKLLRESASFREHLLKDAADGKALADGRAMTDEELAAMVRARELGTELGLLLPGKPLEDWGGREEKWLASAEGTWYFITPDGRLYRWEESSNGPMGLVRMLKRRLGWYELNGQLVTAIGKPSTTEKTNPFYNDPSLLCAPLFETIQTGATIVAELSAEGGALWPIDLTDTNQRPIVARRRALERLTGTLFAPAVPPNFDWTVSSFVDAMDEPARESLIDGHEAVIATTLQQFADERLDGDVSKLDSSLTPVQTAAWYAVFDALAVEPPPRLTCLLVTLTDIAKDNLAYAIGRGTLGSPQGRLLALAEQSGVRPAQPPSTAPPPFNREAPASFGGMPPLRMGGPPVENITIDEEGTVTLARLIGYCILVGVILSYFCFRSFKITIMLFVVGGSAAVLAMAMVGWTGGRVDAILMSMPSLVYVLGLSGSIHVINYYRDEVRFKGRQGAASRALKHAMLPCTLAALTTAIGLASLYTSNLKPISNFGLYSAIGVISTLAILFSYLPAALEVFAPRFGKQVTSGQEATDGDAANSDLQPAGQTNEGGLQLEMARWWVGVGRVVTGHHRMVSIGCLLFLVFASLGLLKIKTSVQLLKLFDSEARILKDYAWLEENFGNLVPMEIVVRMPKELQKEQVDLTTDSVNSSDVSLSLLERVEAVSRIRTVVTRVLGEEGTGEIGQASSMDTFLPPLPATTNGYDFVRSQFNKRISAAKEELLESDYLKIERDGPEAGSELWRLSLRVSALSDNDYGLFIHDLQDVVTPVVKAYQTRASLLKQLRQKDGKLTGQQRVVIVGGPRGVPIDEATLVDQSGKFDFGAIYRSTLAELLAGEFIKRPYWVDVNSEDAKLRPGDAKWEKMIAAADAVIYCPDLNQCFAKNQSISSMKQDAPLPSVAPDWLGLASIAIRADELASAPMQKEIVTLASSSEERLPVFADTGLASPQVVFTGVVPVVYKAQRTLLGSLVESIMLAFVLIAGVMIVLLNPAQFPVAWLRPGAMSYGLAAGAVSMIPNVFPVVLIFGLMGHIGIAVDIGTMMTASVAMGVAVDDTIHFLSWFRQFLEEGKSRVEAVIETYRKVGPAMTQTTIVGGLGLFIFALSTFTPTQRFGTLMLVMLAAALVGDLILLPALLAGPLGKCFKPRSGHLRTEPSLDSGAVPGQPAEAEIELGDQQPASDGSFDRIDGADTESIPVLKLHVPPPSQGEPSPSRKKRR